MKYLFILGRNPELSIAEIFAYFRKEEINLINYVKNKNSLLVDVEYTLDAGLLDVLGGTIAIGKVRAEGEFEDIVKSLGGQDVYYGTSNKLNYVVWNFANDLYSKVSEYLKKRFRQERLKATEKPLTGTLELQNGNKERIVKGKIDEEYFVANNCFGKIIEKTNYKKIEKRDMTKPERRSGLAISPRLAKIMINLSEIKKGKLLDPFCGIGVILQEALLQGLKVIGIDKDKKAINGASKNLTHLKLNKKNYKLIHSDSKKTKVQAEVIVTEPDLGETLKKNITEPRAETQLKEFEDLIIEVLNNLKKGIKGKIVFTGPLIRLVNKKRLGCDIDKILRFTDLKLISKFKEFRSNQTVGRQIFVLGKI